MCSRPLAIALISLVSVACVQSRQENPRTDHEPVVRLSFALGVPSGGFPSWEEQVIYVLTNRARVDPAAEKKGSTYTAKRPLAWEHKQAKAARFQAASLGHAKSGLSHDSVCRLVSNIADIFPDSCDGSPDCACEGGSTKLDCSCADRDGSRTYCYCEGGKCPSAGSRAAAFGASYSGENAAAGNTDPKRTFAQWVGSSGHWSNINNSNHISIGTGFANVSGACWRGFSVQVFGRRGTTPTVGGGIHYPRTGNANTAFTFYANYYDTAGASQLATVNIDGQCRPLTLERGAETLGSFSLGTTLGDGCHRYYFVFRDAAGTLVTYPSSGSYGIGVGSGASSCQFYRSTRPNLGQGCGTCTVAADCDDQNPCTTEQCDVDVCRFTAVADCCTGDAECDDTDVCTRDSCGSNNKCVHTAISGCCKVDSECADLDACTTDRCSSNRCSNQPRAGCCNKDDECDDKDLCTKNSCTDHACVFDPIAGCCKDAKDCDDASDCTTDSCESNACNNTPITGCCVTDADCADNNPCTTARCDPGGAGCIIETDPGCCVGDGDCDDADGCTDDRCEANTCAYESNGTCADAGGKSDGATPSNEGTVDAGTKSPYEHELRGTCSVGNTPPLSLFCLLVFWALRRRQRV